MDIRMHMGSTEVPSWEGFAREKNGIWGNWVANMLCLGCAFLLAPITQAQSWFPTGTTWTYDLASIYYLGYVEHEVTGDTVVDGLACRLIQVTEHYAWLWDGQDVFTVDRDPVVVHEADDLVLIRTEAGFDTLFDLDATIGDRWMLAWASEPCDTTAWAEVMGAGRQQDHRRPVPEMAGPGPAFPGMGRCHCPGHGG